MTNEVPLLSVSNLTRTFENGEVGLRSATFDVYRGEFVAIVGPSGSGKTTLLNVLGLLDTADSGTYKIDGTDVAQFSGTDRDRTRGDKIGFVFQAAHALDDRDALYNAALVLRARGVSRRERTERAWAALGEFGIRDRWRATASQLSGGQRQRLAIARAVAGEPEIILADEPTGSLDRKSGELVLESLKAANARGLTVILITHDLDLAANADRFITINDGIATADASDARNRRTPQGSRFKSQPPRRRPGQGIWDDVLDALSAVSGRLLRTALLVGAFALGIGGLVLASGLSESAATQVSSRLTAAALNEVQVTLPSTQQWLAADDSRFDQLVNRIKSLPHVESVGFFASIPAETAHVRRFWDNEPEPERAVTLLTADSTFLRMRGVDRGENSAPLELLDDARATGVAWAGKTAAANLDLASPGTGSSLRALHQRVDLVGTLDSKDGTAQESSSWVVVSKDLLADAENLRVTVVVRTEMGYPAAVADAIPLALDPANPGQFGIQTVADLRDLQVGVSDDLGGFVLALSLILLLLATASASATMYLSVQSRRTEIGLRRAVGATKASIARQFLAEGACVGLLGGAVASSLGAAGILLICNLRNWEPTFSLTLIPTALIVGVASGVFSAVLPALVASRQDPAVSLRSS
ncbi:MULTISPECIES: ABC transporter ATP-binding protein/permease [unclassified Salinibacterium]|uniref:ABC transporter ATP-binding protein/permease n=1 Tax=unclassified Salinibacterium TaxID=2632331 RepID=UPI001421FC62|nr:MULTISPECIES: ABC transporter ATP-binding protein/permease [unclassified Salinibacterium]